MRKITLITLMIFLTSGFLFAEKRCSYCHRDEANALKVSVHKDELECASCHGEVPDNHNRIINFETKVNCLECHEDMKGIANTVHKKALFDEKKGVYMCWKCHGKHFILGKDSLYSKVNESNLSDTCLECHTEIKGKCGGVKFAKFRISAHEKFFTGKKYSEDKCLKCHHGSVVHGEKGLEKSDCNKCHNKNFHLQKSPALAELNFVIFIFLILGIFCVGFRFIKEWRKD